MFPCCFSWGVRAAAAPLAVVESVTARVSVLPGVGSELPTVYEVGNGALDVVGLRVGQSCLRMDSEDTLPTLQDERCVMSFLVRPAAVLISQVFLSYDEHGDDGFSPDVVSRSLVCHVDLDSLWMVHREDCRTGSHIEVSVWRRVLCGVARMSCLRSYRIRPV